MATFTPEEKAALAAPLHREHVKSRSQSGRSLSYIEGWHAIAEMNRIFGFDGWTRETLELRCIAEHERSVGTRGDKGWGVSYLAKVRVIAHGIAREGYGTGHGIDRDLGLAHESALKEAETDAMKRAMMTFGNPFGLALYDKTQANVVDGETAEIIPITEGPKRSAHSIKTKEPEAWPMVVKMFRDCQSYKELKETAASEFIAAATKDWPISWVDLLREEEYKPLARDLKAAEEVANNSVVWAG